jgi:hypothetical protein
MELKEVHLLLGQYQQQVAVEVLVEMPALLVTEILEDLVAVRLQKLMVLDHSIQEEQQLIIQDQINKDILVVEHINMLEEI